MNERKNLILRRAMIPSQTHEKASQSRFYCLYGLIIPWFIAFLEIFQFLLDFHLLHECKSLLFIRTTPLIVNHMHKYFLLIAMYINKGEHNIAQSTISTLNVPRRNPYTELMFTSCTLVAAADGIIDFTIFNANRAAIMVRMIFIYFILPPPM